MSARLGLVSLAALAVAAAAVPAEAAQGREPWARVGEWQVRPNYPGRCSATRQYPGGTRIFISSHRDGSAGLLVGNRAWSRRNPGTHRLALIQGGAPRGFVAKVEEGFIGLNLSAQAGSGLLAQLTTSGSAALDSTTCRLLRARARFSPALDRKGRVTTDILYGRIIWRMPPEPPPPPPPSSP